MRPILAGRLLAVFCLVHCLPTSLLRAKFAHDSAAGRHGCEAKGTERRWFTAGPTQQTGPNRSWVANRSRLVPDWSGGAPNGSLARQTKWVPRPRGYNKDILSQGRASGAESVHLNRPRTAWRQAQTRTSGKPATTAHGGEGKCTGGGTRR